MDPNIPTKGFLTNVRFMFDLRDVVIDVQVGQGQGRGRGWRWGWGPRRAATVRALRAGGRECP
jgi:hypothetical protein